MRPEIARFFACELALLRALRAFAKLGDLAHDRQQRQPQPKDLASGDTLGVAEVGDVFFGGAAIHVPREQAKDGPKTGGKGENLIPPALKVGLLLLVGWKASLDQVHCLPRVTPSLTDGRMH
jgi:hypothetical protein